MKRLVLPLVVVALVVVLVSCSDSTGPGQVTPVVTGTVTDAAGLPVADAAVVLDLDIVVTYATIAEEPPAMFALTLPDRTPREVRITDACDDAVIYTHVDTLAGDLRFGWDGRDNDGRQVPEGVYHYQVTAPEQAPLSGETVVARNMGDDPGSFASATCATVRESWRVAAWTDGRGRFRIASGCWDFGRSVAATGETGEDLGTVTVKSRVRAWVYPANRDHGVGSAWADFDSTSGATIELTLPPAVVSAR